MNSVLQQFLVGKEEHNTLRLCGKEFRQDEDVGIRVTAKDNTERLLAITCDAKHSLTQKAIASEVHQLRSVTTHGSKDKHALIFHTAFPRYPHVAFIYHQIFLGTMQLS